MTKVQDEFSDYDDLIAAADTDDRVGYHDFTVSSNTESSHPKIDGGEPFRKIEGNLDTSNRAKVDFILTRIVPKEEIEAMQAAGQQTRMTLQGITMQRELLRIYGKRATTLEQGDVIRINVIKNKEGFIRVVAVLPKDAVQAKKAAPAAKAKVEKQAF